MTELKMYEKELYPAVEKFLKAQKNCLSEYVGTELFLKRGKTRLRADVFRVSNQDEQIIYLCERLSNNLIIPHNINNPKHTLEYIVIVYPAK